MITDMNQLEQREYQDYINTVSNSGTNSPEGRDKAFLANSHFPRPAGPHFPASQGHIKRPVLEISRVERVPPC